MNQVFVLGFGKKGVKGGGICVALSRQHDPGSGAKKKEVSIQKFIPSCMRVRRP